MSRDIQVHPQKQTRISTDSNNDKKQDDDKQKQKQKETDTDTDSESEIDTDEEMEIAKQKVINTWPKGKAMPTATVEKQARHKLKQMKLQKQQQKQQQTQPQTQQAKQEPKPQQQRIRKRKHIDESEDEEEISDKEDNKETLFSLRSALNTASLYEVDQILTRRYNQSKNEWEWKVQWKGEGKHQTWEPLKHLKCRRLYEEFKTIPKKSTTDTANRTTTSTNKVTSTTTTATATPTATVTQAVSVSDALAAFHSGRDVPMWYEPQRAGYHPHISAFSATLLGLQPPPGSALAKAMADANANAASVSDEFEDDLPQLPTIVLCR